MHALILQEAPQALNQVFALIRQAQSQRQGGQMVIGTHRQGLTEQSEIVIPPYASSSH
jgi:molybdopterin synthase catalytic subunit